MRVLPRSLRAELPEASDLRPAPPADLTAEEMRLGRALARPVAPRTSLEPPPRVTEEALARLGAAVSLLASEERDAAALAVLDDPGRQRLAPALSKVRGMAQTVDALLDLRRQAMGRLRAQGQG